MRASTSSRRARSPPGTRGAGDRADLSRGSRVRHARRSTPRISTRPIPGPPRRPMPAPTPARSPRCARRRTAARNAQAEALARLAQPSTSGSSRAASSSPPPTAPSSTWASCSRRTAGGQATLQARAAPTPRARCWRRTPPSGAGFAATRHWLDEARAAGADAAAARHRRGRPECGPGRGAGQRTATSTRARSRAPATWRRSSRTRAATAASTAGWICNSWSARDGAVSERRGRRRAAGRHLRTGGAAMRCAAGATRP